jgi:hypothetical protein
LKEGITEVSKSHSRFAIKPKDGTLSENQSFTFWVSRGVEVMNEETSAKMRKLGKQCPLRPYKGSQEREDRSQTGNGMPIPTGKMETDSGNLTLMEKVVADSNIQEAIKRVKKNKGAPGADGMRVDELDSHFGKHWDSMKEKLLRGMYIPREILRVDIPKPGSKETRKLGIPIVQDRVLQQAILQILQDIFEPDFSDNSFGFRPGRSAHDALLKAKEHVQAGFNWVVDIDLEKFFDKVNHDMLMSRIAKKVGDKSLLKTIRRYLNAGILDMRIPVNIDHPIQLR